MIHWTSVLQKEARKRAQIFTIQRYGSTVFCFESPCSMIYLPGQCVFWSPHLRGKPVVALILCFDEFQFMYLDFPTLISHSIETLSTIQGYRGDVHHPSFPMIWGSLIFIKFLLPATLAGIFMLTGEDGGSGHRPFARWIVDRVMASPDLISTLGSYDFFKYHVFLIDSSLPWARACGAFNQPRQLMRLDQTLLVFSPFLISDFISFISFNFKIS
jgi:hypothetical protein